MSRKSLIITLVTCIIFVNSAVVLGLYVTGHIFQPTAEEIEAQRLAEEKARKEAEAAIKYAHLEPLPEFKSRIGYVASMGEAIGICEELLHTKEKSRKSWAINYIESRYVEPLELYKVFIDYETIVPAGQEAKKMKVTCEVEEPTKVVSNWKAMPAK